MTERPHTMLRRTLPIDFIEVAMPEPERAGCAACDSARARLDAAIAAAGPILDQIEIDIAVREILVRTRAEAKLLRLRASPTIRIHGKEIAPEHGEGEKRAWHWRGQALDLPPANMIVEAILAAAADPVSLPTAPYALPSYLGRFLADQTASKRPRVHLGVDDDNEDIAGADAVPARKERKSA